MSSKRKICAWCKGALEHAALITDNDELICARCVGKYRYAEEVGLSKGALTTLSKQERIEISIELEELRVFSKSISLTDRQSLAGIPRIANILVIATMIITFFLALGWLMNRLGEDSLLFLGATAGLLCVLTIIYFRIRWSLKFWQLKRKTGYKFKWWELKP